MLELGTHGQWEVRISPGQMQDQDSPVGSLMPIFLPVSPMKCIFV